MPMMPVQQLVVVIVSMSLIMVFLWLQQKGRGDAGIVDVGWSAGLGLSAIFYAVSSEGEVSRRLLLAVLAGGWSLRLTGYLLKNRILRGEEDGRYRRLRLSWGVNAQYFFFLFFQFQALLVLLFSLPLLVVAHSRMPSPSGLDIAGILIFITAVTGEAVADRQLTRFRSQAGNKGKTCRQGLWRYSRHPNYFFEWLYWWTYVAMGVGAPAWWVTLLGPILMWIFLFKVTGIPATEEQALATRGEDYRQYQRTTSRFIPWFPKEG